MINFYLKVKFITEIILPIVMIGIILLLGVIAVISSIIEHYIWQKKTNYLKSIGFERYLISVASVGNKAWYGWQREDVRTFGLRISEEELKKISYKKLKERYPG